MGRENIFQDKKERERERERENKVERERTSIRCKNSGMSCKLKSLSTCSRDFSVS
jgi:hypothetical protein